MSTKKEKNPVPAPQLKSTTKSMRAFTVEQVQAIGNYLVNRPYGEVKQFIQILETAPEVQVTFTENPAPEKPVAGEDSAPEAVKA